MCEYYDRILEEGYAKGYAEGYAEGLEEGMASARAKRVKVLMESLDKGPEEVLDLLNVFGKERQTCLSALGA